LAVEDEEGPVPLMDDLFYLVPALDPAEAGVAAARSVIQPTRLLRQALPRTDLMRYAAVILVNCAEMTPSEQSALTGYVTRGGCVIFFPGDRVKLDAYKQYTKGLGPDGIGLLPAQLVKAVGEPDERDNPATLVRLEDEHPIMTAFRGLPQALVESIHAYRYYELAIPQGSGGVPLAWLSNDKPFLVHRRMGLGHTFLFCTTANTTWSNFPIRVLFLPMMHQIIYYVVGQREESSSLLAGAPMNFMPDMKGRRPEVEITDPMGNRTRLTNRRGEKAVGPVRFGATFRRGVYKWRFISGPGRKGAFVVNANSRESELDDMDEDGIRKLFGEKPVYFARTSEEARQIAERMRTGVQLWNLILLLVIGLAVAECFLANRRQGLDPTAQDAAQTA